MDSIKRLLETRDRLLGPGGCAWDQKQTLKTVLPDLLEEVCELIDAIDEKDRLHVEEELGDVLFVIFFVGSLAEKERFTTLSKAAEAAANKLIRRHPHVFSEQKNLTEEEVVSQWAEIKKKEKGGKEPSPFARIPKSLPALSRANEVLSVYKKMKVEVPLPAAASEEDKIGIALFEIVKRAKELKIDPELALRGVLGRLPVPS